MLAKLALGNVRKAYRDFAIYFITLAAGVCIFYAFNSIEAEQSALDLEFDQRATVESLANIIGMVSVAVAVVLGFLVVYANQFLLRRRSREFGIYQVLGMSRREVSLVLTAETLFVGVGALAAGLLAGVALSQLMLYLTATMFRAQVAGFTFVFSPEAAVRTVVYFAIMFAVALALGAGSISRTRLVRLIDAERSPDEPRLRNLPLAVALFCAACTLIIWAYRRLMDHGLLVVDPKQFGATTAIVTAGTFLFFYALSGFVLRAVQTMPRVYLRGLNMFTLRQLNSRVNSSFASIALVCMVLFLALTSTCTGFSLATALNANLAEIAPYDATLQAYPFDEDEYPEEAAQARADGYDIDRALRRDLPGYTDVVRAAAQIDVYSLCVGEDDNGEPVFAPTFGQIVEQSGYVVDGVWAQSTGLLDSHLRLVTASQFNAVRALRGLDPVEVPQGTYLFDAGIEKAVDMLASFSGAGLVLDLDGLALAPASPQVVTDALYDISIGGDTGVVVVNDADLPEGARVGVRELNVMYNGDRNELDEPFGYMLFDKPAAATCWPLHYIAYTTAQEIYNENSGLATIASYLAIYIGIVLFVACAAILALQQLCAASDNAPRYRTLARLGAEESLMRRSLLMQIGVYFLFPLALACAHSAVALAAVGEVVSIFGHLDIARSLAVTAGIAVALYGGYFLATYLAARSMTVARASSRQD